MLLYREPLFIALPASRKVKSKSMKVSDLAQEKDSLQTTLTLVAADQGVSIVPSCALSLRVDGVKLLRIRPDNVRIELVLAWPKQADSPVTKTFLDLVKKRHDLIHRKATVVS